MLLIYIFQTCPCETTKLSIVREHRAIVTAISVFGATMPMLES